MHSTWSDGSQTLADIVEAGINLGYAFCAVTDHSYGLKIAGGVSMAELAEQHQEIDALNRKHRGAFRLLKGIEANIRARRHRSTWSRDELAQLEIVVAAPHSVLRSPRRSDRADGGGGVRAGRPHPRPSARPDDRIAAGRAADWDRVFEAAAAIEASRSRSTAIRRGRISTTTSPRRAVDAGCLFALDSDAHSTGELPRYAQTAIAHARLAGVPTDRMINCWPLERLLEWAPSRSAAPERLPRGQA